MGQSACSVSENEAGANAHGGGKINFEIVFSAIEKAGKSLTIEMYPAKTIDSTGTTERAKKL
jgi:hypothetical protein